MMKIRSHIASLKETVVLLSGNPIVLSGTIVVLGIVIVAAVAPFLISQHVATSVNLSNQLLPPSTAHWFGTDDLGRDVFGLVMLATSYDMSAAALILLISSTVGILLGTVAGYFGGKLDETIMRITDIFLAFPSLVLAMAVAAVLGRSLLNLVLAITITHWSSVCRLIRGQSLAERGKPYADSLEVLGIPRRRIILRHIIPNTIYPVLVYITTQIGFVILTFAGLNYIGFGPGPLTPEWGELIATAQTYIFQDPTLVLFPGLAIFITSMAFNLLGDGLRDVFDPKLRK